MSARDLLLRLHPHRREGRPGRLLVGGAIVSLQVLVLLSMILSLF